MEEKALNSGWLASQNLLLHIVQQQAMATTELLDKCRRIFVLPESQCGQL